MKFFMVFAVTFCLALSFVSQSLALPADDEAHFVDGLEALKTIEPELHGRYKRATCDLLSGTGVKHSACAAHCLLRGNRGGYCNGRAICVCRN
ncbi:defensin Lucifensin [Lucilia sericata]|uniref:Defensin Lucifensin n=1 Tax=Lucilia sericata TaxID=13632 RepID=DEFLU_LUCSE|nr:defensin Lucifensin [Lucilia sericata]P86471.2 RecName: Full=Defensin Lucifensin; AltName: Full=Sericasin; Flags: Precursor [Lucilia sericata]ADI87383.1 lucifensin [Lucilia sericata]